MCIEIHYAYDENPITLAKQNFAFFRQAAHARNNYAAQWIKSIWPVSFFSDWGPIPMAGSNIATNAVYPSIFLSLTP